MKKDSEEIQKKISGTIETIEEKNKEKTEGSTNSKYLVANKMERGVRLVISKLARSIF